MTYFNAGGSRLLCRVMTALLCWSALPLSAQAQEGVLIPPTAAAPACPETPQLPHVLGGHNFLPLLLFPSPFVDTQTDLVIAGAYGSYPNGSSLPLLGSADLKLGGFQTSLNIQYSPMPRFALSLGFLGNLLTGMNSSSALAYGASIATQWQIGGLLKLYETDRLILSLGLLAQFPHYLSISPTNLIAGFNRAVSVGAPDFVPENVSSSWRPNLRFAYVFNPTFGFSALAGIKAYALEQSNPDQSNLQVDLALGVTSDFYPQHGVPIGLTAAYRRNQVVQSSDVNTNVFSFGLWETRWTQVAFGLEVGFSNVAGQNSTIAALGARVYY